MEQENNPSESINKIKSTREPKQNNFLISLLSILLLISVFIAGFFAYQTQRLAKELRGSKVLQTPTITAISTKTPVVSPSITAPKENSSITSPVTIFGFVPQGWMFEGSFPIKIVDENKKLIKQVVAKEVVSGSWTSQDPVEFSATVTFETKAAKGYVILENDNPSGLPENKKSHEIQIFFANNQTACTMDAKICPDGSSVGRSGPKCEFAPCPTPKP